MQFSYCKLQSVIVVNSNYSSQCTQKNIIIIIGWLALIETNFNEWIYFKHTQKKYPLPLVNATRNFPHQFAISDGSFCGSEL